MLKTQKEKMLAGELYLANDEELVKEREYAKTLIYEFNKTSPSEKKERKNIVKRLIVSKGSAYIEPPFYCDYGYNIEVGENFYANHCCIILDVCKVSIGDNVLLGPSVQIYTATHPLNKEERLSGKEFGKEISIGNNAWIGGGAIICPGVKVGANSVIAAGSVVIKDIPDNVLAGGNPCKVIKSIE